MHFLFFTQPPPTPRDRTSKASNRLSAMSDEMEWDPLIESTPLNIVSDHFNANSCPFDCDFIIKKIVLKRIKCEC